MPTYEYHCASCGKSFEKIHAMSENPDVICPECGAKALRQISGGAGIIMKGGNTQGSCCGIDSPCSDPKRCCEK
ncbi:zinc ribbon domain-containing protein [candidate division WOR-3 bacterium]|nr:zinc ribbon domain-containing protein [candidate division WOR-3 bacterium]